jgi:hypothetical protein
MFYQSCKIFKTIPLKQQWMLEKLNIFSIIYIFVFIIIDHFISKSGIPGINHARRVVQENRCFLASNGQGYSNIFLVFNRRCVWSQWPSDLQ